MIRTFTLFLALVAALASGAARAHTVSKFVDATLVLPSDGEVGDLEARLVLQSVWSEPIRVELSERPQSGGGPVLYPGQQIEFPVRIAVGSGPKQIISIPVRIRSGRGVPIGRTTANAYLAVVGDAWFRGTYKKLYTPELATVEGATYWQVPSWLSADRSVASAPPNAALSSVSGWLSVLDSNGKAVPGRQWHVVLANQTTGERSPPVVADSEGGWTASIPATLGDSLQIFYRPENGYVQVRPEGGEAYEFSTGRVFVAGERDLVETLDFSSRTGVLPGLVDFFATTAAYRVALQEADLSPDRAAPIRVYFPNDGFGCGGADSWSCAEPSGEVWLAAQHSLEAETVMHELSHQLDHEYHDNARPPGVDAKPMADRCHNPGLALVEGFANALTRFVQFGAAAGPVALETPDRARICNGEANETWVAATFWDLVDAEDDNLDRFAYAAPADAFRAYLEAPMRDSIRDYLPEFRAISDDPSGVDDVFDNNTIRVDFPLRPAGGSGGDAYRIVCAQGAYLVGVRGGAGALLDNVEGICLDTEGNDASTSRVGGAGGAAFTRRCPEGKLVSALSGRAGRLVHRLVLECRSASGTRWVGAAEAIEGVGGDGGREFPTRQCPAGMAGIGFEGRADRFINQLALVCDKLGWIALDRWESPMVGGNGGEAFAFDCPAGEVLAGVELRAGRFVDAIRPLCASVAGTTRGELSEASDFHGGNAGTPQSQRCPAGSVLSGIQGRAGRFVNSMRVRCQPLDGGEAQLLSPVGGGGGAPFDMLECPEGLFAKGIRGRAGGLLDALSLSCDALSTGPSSAEGPPSDLRAAQ